MGITVPWNAELLEYDKRPIEVSFPSADRTAMPAASKFRPNTWAEAVRAALSLRPSISTTPVAKKPSARERELLLSSSLRACPTLAQTSLSPGNLYVQNSASSRAIVVNPAELETALKRDKKLGLE